MKIDVDFEIFGVLAFYSSILLLKMLFMPVLVARARMNKKVSENETEHCSDDEKKNDEGDGVGNSGGGSDGDGVGDDSVPSASADASASSEVFANPEDKSFARGGEVSIKHTDQDIERIRRAHLNDMENILPFIPLAVLYCFTSPGVCAGCLFQVFTVARIAHTIFYLVPRVRSAWARFFSCAIGFGINVYMAYCVFVHNL